MSKLFSLCPLKRFTPLPLRCLSITNINLISNETTSNSICLTSWRCNLPLPYAPQSYFSTVASSSSVIPYRQPRELTIYVRGFLTPEDDIADWADWSASHTQLSKKYNWSPLFVNYPWQSGALTSFYSIPVPFITAAATAYITLRRIRLLTPAAIPWLAATATAEIVFLAARLAYAYSQAYTASTTDAYLLTNYLKEKRAEYDYVRVVAFSLGARHLIQSVLPIKHDQRPDEIHLLAPAISTKEATETFTTPLTRILYSQSNPTLSMQSTSLSNPTHIYYTPNDYVLSILFRLIHYGDTAIGCTGIVNPNLTPPISNSHVRCINVSDKLPYMPTVHGDYKKKWGEMAVPIKRIEAWTERGREFEWFKQFSEPELKRAIARESQAASLAASRPKSSLLHLLGILSSGVGSWHFPTFSAFTQQKSSNS